MPLAPGTQLGPYAIESLIGSGGMGEVYKAHDARLNRTVAIKRLIAEDVNRLQSEARAFAMLLRGDLRLVLSAPSAAAGGGQSMPDGTHQAPGGWNRFAIQVSDL